MFQKSITLSGWSSPIPNKLHFKKPKWIKAVPYGVFTLNSNIQKLNKTAAQNITKHFYSLSSKFIHLFKPIPITIPNAPKNSPKIGSVSHLLAQDDGLYFQPKFTDYGKSLLKSKKYKHFSPIWSLKQSKPNTFLPHKLIAISLTSSPTTPTPTLDTNPSLTIQNLNTQSSIPSLQQNTSHNLLIHKIHNHMHSNNTSYLQSYNHIKNQFPGTYYNA